MRDNKLYPVAFIVVLCVGCASVLTFANSYWRGLIEANENFARMKAIVQALGLVAQDVDRGAVIGAYDSAVVPTKKGEMAYYEARRGEELLGYAVEIEGRGKYGPIRGILALAPSKQEILNLRIYEQHETGGLGGRIASMDWLGQFSGKTVTGGLVFDAGMKGPNIIKPVSGASKTMFSMSKILNKAIAQFLAGGAALAELDLKLDADSVTRSTPGYPKNLQKPPHLREEVRRAAFLVPEGDTVNLSENKPVTCSMEDEPIIGELAQITDDVKKSGQFDYVELDPGPQWVQVDLGAVHTTYAVVVWHYYKNPVIYNDVIVQVSDDAEFKQNVINLFNNDHDNSSEQGEGKDTAYFSRWWGEIADARGADNEGTKCRYVRVWTNGGCGDEDTRFVEIQVYGRADEE